MAIDPVCGMTVDEATGRKAERNGQDFYFCSEHCRKKFLGEGAPATAKPDEPEHSHQAPSERMLKDGAGEFFCPMCADVESDEPGNCPKCGMALESAQPQARQRITIYTCPMHPEIEQD